MSGRGLVALSGNRFSAVTAALVQNEYAGLEAVHFQWDPVQTEIARRIAQRFELHFQVIDVREELEATVLESLDSRQVQSMHAGFRDLFESLILFPKLEELAVRRGFDFVFTGHYAQILVAHDAQTKLASIHVLQPVEELPEVTVSTNDAYRLAYASPILLPRLKTPLGSLSIESVERLAKEFGILEIVAQGDSPRPEIPGRPFEAARILGRKAKFLNPLDQSGVWNGQVRVGAKNAQTLESVHVVQYGDDELELYFPQSRTFETGDVLTLIQEREILGIAEVWKSLEPKNTYSKP